MNDYDEGYRAGMQKMREVGQRRIEELEAENKRLKSLIADVIHDTGDDPKIMAASRAEWATRALAAEAKLAKTMEVVEMIASADVDAVLGQAVDLSCEIIGELMEDEDDE